MRGASLAERKQDRSNGTRLTSALFTALFLFLSITLAGCGEEQAAEPTAGDAQTTQTAQTPPAEATEPVRDPGQLYAEYCAGCHEGGVFKAPHVVTFQMMSPERMLETMQGVMAQQAAQLSQAEKMALSEFLTGQAFGQQASKEVLMCAEAASPFDYSDTPVTRSWGVDAANSRFIPGEDAGITKEEVANLKVDWVFAYPNATRARSQPMLAGGAVFVGSQDGTVYALDQQTGCVRWLYEAAAEVRSAISISPWEKGNEGAEPAVFFGDFQGNVYSLNALTGEPIWVENVEDHPDVIITGSPKLHDGALYVPMSSNEWASAADPGYECCTFRGGIVAFDAKTGERLWKTHSIPDEPKRTGKTNPLGTPLWHPAGAPTWNSPTIDEKRGLLYVGTGEAYTSPAAPTSDAILAMSLETGEIEWVFQATQGDAWNLACTLPDDANCPEEDGPDFDFGAPPILTQTEEGDDILIAGQKAGLVYGLNPDDGSVLWKKRTGLGGFAGGVHWGMAAEPGVVYVPNADTNFYDKWEGERKPGLYALEAGTGEEIWFTPNPNVCPEELKPECDPGLSAAVTAIPGVVFAGGFDGWLRAYDSETGEVLFRFNTVRDFETVNGEIAAGGSIESDGPIIGNGRLFLNSGYLYGGRMPGNVLIVFRPSEDGENGQD